MVTEIQPIILAAGKGSRITEISTSIPKCLLPIANKPMIYYPIKMLEEANFKDVIIVVGDSQESEISAILNDNFKIKIEYYSIPFAKDLGTADSLRLLKNRIKSDVLLISSDTLTDFQIHRLVDFHRMQNSTITALVSTLPTMTEGSVPGKKGKGKFDKDLIGIDKLNDNRLVFLSSEADFEEDVILRKSLLTKCSNFEMHMDYTDAHIYIIKKWIIKYLEDKPSISSIKGELIPSLIKKQYKKEKKLLSDAKNEKKIESVISSMPGVKPEVLDYKEHDIIIDSLQKLELSNESSENVFPNSTIKCFAYLLDEGFCLRSNQILAYAEANKQMPKFLTDIQNPISPIPPSSSKVQIGNDCMVGKGTKIGQKTSIKRSVIGNHSSIGDKVKLANSVVMDKVVIGEGCSIQGSIICSNVRIGNSADIKDCVVAAGQEVVALVKFSNEVITDVDHLMQL